MGLDISAYSRLTKIINPGEGRDDLITLTDNTDFPGRAAPFTTGHYEPDEEMDVFSMGYGSYNGWRDWLAKIAGYHSARDMWAIKEPAPSGIPFWEIINFSDCEGTIGTVACKKLLKDFEAYDESAKLASESWFYDKYVELHEGLKLAVHGGALRFA